MPENLGGSSNDSYLLLSDIHSTEMLSVVVGCLDASSRRALGNLETVSHMGLVRLSSSPVVLGIMSCCLRYYVLLS